MTNINKVNPPLLLPIENLPLEDEKYMGPIMGPKMKRLCKLNGILLLGELLANSPQRLIKQMHNFGQKAVKDWKKFLADYFPQQKLDFAIIDFIYPDAGLIPREAYAGAELIKLEGDISSRIEQLRQAYAVRPDLFINPENVQIVESIGIKFTIKGPFYHAVAHQVSQDLRNLIEQELPKAYERATGKKFKDGDTSFEIHLE